MTQRARQRSWPHGLVALFLLGGAGCEDPASGSSPVGGDTGSTVVTTAGGTTATGGTSGGTTAAGSTTTGGSPATTGEPPVQVDAGDQMDAGGDTGVAPGGCKPFEMPADCSIPEGAVLPGELRCSGLYGDWETRELACGVMEYAPAYALWSDGARKVRYAYIPPGETIDASDPDDLRYPEGTMFWKEFWVGPPGDQKLGETRYLLKDRVGWLYTTYVWDEQGTNAIQQNEGVVDLFGSGHEVPTRDQCKDCHAGRPDYVLGWDLFMLGAGAEGVTLDTLMSMPEGPLLAGMPPGAQDVTVPGDDVERAALGYLHANCGVSCHNGSTLAPAKMSGLHLRLEMDGAGDVHSTPAVVTGINRAPAANAEVVGLPLGADEYYDFRPLDPERSMSVARMVYRGSATAMPPLGTHVIDDEGVALVRAWVEHMTEERGYPAPAP